MLHTSINALATHLGILSQPKVGWPCQDFTQGSNREQPKRLMREMITAWAWINCQTNQAGENSLFLMHCTGGDLSQGHGRTAKFRTSASHFAQTIALVLANLEPLVLANLEPLV